MDGKLGGKLEEEGAEILVGRVEHQGLRRCEPVPVPNPIPNAALSKLNETNQVAKSENWRNLINRISNATLTKLWSTISCGRFKSFLVSRFQLGTAH